MYFYYELPIPFNTFEANPVILRPKLAEGTLEFIDIGVPRRVQRFAKCKVYYREFQIVPFNRDGWFAGEDVTLRIPINLKIDALPYEMVIMGINEDDTFNHTLSFGISVITDKTMTLAELASLFQYSKVTD